MKFMKFVGVICLLQILFFGCTTTGNKEWGNIEYQKDFKKTFYESGYASFYDDKWTGRKTASGEVFDSNLLTAASKTLPFNTKVLVKDVKTGRFVIVRINDRGPYWGTSRIIDLSEAAAKKLGIHKKGVAKVDIYIVNQKS